MYRELTFTGREQNELIEMAREDYIDLPYHNFDHALGSTDIGLAAVQALALAGLRVNADAVFLGGLEHDSRFYLLPPPQHSKEWRSARTAGMKWRQCDVDIPEPTIKTAQHAIRPTEVGVPLVTLEDRCVRRGDLDNLTSNYLTVVRNTFLLFRESQQLAEMHGTEPPSMHAFLSGSVSALQWYTQDGIHVPEIEKSTVPEFIFRNVGLLGSETPESFTQKTG